VQGKDSNAALPLHPHPAPVYHDGKIQALSIQRKPKQKLSREFRKWTRIKKTRNNSRISR
jgi:hypothetical protein